MIVRDLIKRLLYMPQDSIVLLQKDAEGNRYSLLSGADTVYKAWRGEIYSTDWTASEASMGEEKWEEFKSSTPVYVVLYPVD